jgi:hypothetical protein
VIVGEPQPGVSTLDAIDNAITSNMAIVPTSNGTIDVYASGLTQLVLDISATSHLTYGATPRSLRLNGVWPPFSDAA